MNDDLRWPSRRGSGRSASRVMETAFRILARRDHFSSELTRKLRRKGHGQQAVDEAVRRCRELGYLDDAQTARMMAERWFTKGYGPLWIRQSLKQKGLDEALIAAILTDSCPEQAQVHAARKALEKKAARLRREKDPWKRRQIAYRYLLGRGFPSAVISQVTDETR